MFRLFTFNIGTKTNKTKQKKRRKIENRIEQLYGSENWVIYLLLSHYLIIKVNGWAKIALRILPITDNSTESLCLK